MIVRRTRNPYAEQLTRGVGPSFVEELEREFRQWLAAQHQRRVDVAVVCAVVLFSLFGYKDYFMLPPQIAQITAGVRLLLIVPAIAFVYAAVRSRPPRVLEAGLCVGAAVGLYGLSGAYLATLSHPGALPYEGLLLVTLFTYFMVGLRVIPAAIVCLPLVLAFAPASLAMGSGLREALLDTFYLFAANVIGVIGGYWHEKANRQAFLALRSSEFAATHDALTGLRNRASVLERVETAFRQARREGVQIAVFLIDVDHFKAYNDHYGHVAGDQALVQVAGALESCVKRPMDSVGRYGGEEFIAVAYGVARIDDAVALAERMRAAVEALAIPHERSPYRFVTCSIGVAMGEGAASYADLIVQADLALYDAKEAGRNTVRFRQIRGAVAGADELPEYGGAREVPREDAPTGD